MDYKQKYLKYKMKYLQTKNLVSQNNSLRGGAAVAEPEYINEQQFNQLPLLEKFKYTEYYRRKTAEEMQADNNYVLGQEQITYNALTNSQKLFYTQRTQINDNQQNNLNRTPVLAYVGQPYIRNTNLLNFAIANQNNLINQSHYIQVSVYDTLQNEKTYYNSNSKIYSRKTNDQIFEILINLERNINYNQYQILSPHFKSLYNKMVITEDPNTYTSVPTPIGLQRIAKYQLKQEAEQLQDQLQQPNGEAA